MCSCGSTVLTSHPGWLAAWLLVKLAGLEMEVWSEAVALGREEWASPSWGLKISSLPNAEVDHLRTMVWHMLSGESCVPCSVSPLLKPDRRQVWAGLVVPKIKSCIVSWRMRMKKTRRRNRWPPKIAKTIRQMTPKTKIKTLSSMKYRLIRIVKMRHLQ